MCMTGKLSRNRVFSFLTVAILPAMLAGCVNLWYIPGEAGDGPVVNNTAPSAVPLSLAVQEMINFLTVTGMMNNWQDIAVVCDNATPVGDLKETILNAGGEYLKECNLFDVYTGSHMESGKKSVAFSLIMRSDTQTLTDATADEVFQSVLQALKEKHGAVIRS